MNATAGSLLRMEPLAAHHDRSGFTSGMPDLDRYIRDLAHPDPRHSGAAVFVMADGEGKVRGFYALSALSVPVDELPAGLGGGSEPEADPAGEIPATLLQRMAFDRRDMGSGIGERLFADAFFRAWAAARHVPSRGIVADARNAPLLKVSRYYGFQEFPGDRNRLFLPMATLEKVFGG